MFTINRKALAAELSLLQTVAERKTTVPILAFVRFDVSNGKATLTATDLDVSLITELPASGQDWNGCIPLRQLLSLVKLFTEEDVEFTEKPNSRIEVKSAKSKHLLPTFPISEYPEVGAITGEKVSVDANVLATMLTRTSFCAATEENNQYAFQCINFNVKDRQLILTATNSRQLATMNAPISSDSELEVLIPTRAVSSLQSLCANEGEVEFTANDNHAMFQLGERIVIARLMVGRFPEWKALIADTMKHRVTIDPKLLSASVKRACVTARESKLIRHPLRFTFSKKELEIVSQSEDGESSDTLPFGCKSLNGSAVTVGVNGEHFINFVSRTEGKINCAFDDNPTRIELTLENDPSYRYVTMPLRW